MKNNGRELKKVILIVESIVLLIMFIVFIIKFGPWNNNEIHTFGKSMTIYEVLGDDNIDINEYRYLEDYTFVKAKVKVKDIGSTAHQEIDLDNNKIVFLGNRNLVEINGDLYVYTEKSK